MGPGPVSTSPSKPPSWHLAPHIGIETQGLVVSGFGALPFGRALFLQIGAHDGTWLHRLLAEDLITHASHDAAPSRAAAMAFTATGLTRLGLPEQALASFSRPFRQGMFQEDRLRRLGDRRKRKWSETVINPDGPGTQGPVWSANTPVSNPGARYSDDLGGFDVERGGDGEEEVLTPVTVHALLLLYTREEAEAEQWANAMKAELSAKGVETVRELDLLLDVIGTDKFSREHFGFADGLSQPAPFGLDKPIDERACVLVNGKAASPPLVQAVPLGEVLIGYQNGHSEPAPGPVVEQDERTERAGLRAHRLGEGFADLGVNGSYLVVRELKQDVAAFWQSLKDNAERMRAADPSATDIDELWLAERIIGRDIDGHLLCPAPKNKLGSDRYGRPDNDFHFRPDDAHGLGCPLGSHVRRANPRDGLARDDEDETRQAMVKAANNHRILRRGRKFGAKATDRYTPDDEDRGLLFMCLNTDIERQFEFVQQTWLLNSSFATLFNETDPLLGPKGEQTIPGTPIRRTIEVESYVRMAGGDYFFLPSLPALKYLSSL